MINYKLTPGAQVKIVEEGIKINRHGWCSDMMNYVGKVVTIDCITSKHDPESEDYRDKSLYTYRIKEDHKEFLWTGVCFDEVYSSVEYPEFEVETINKFEESFFS